MIPPAAQDLADAFSLDELKAYQKVLLRESIAPGSITSQDMEGLAITAVPKTAKDMDTALDRLRLAIGSLEGTLDDGGGPQNSSSFDFSARRTTGA